MIPPAADDDESQSLLPHGAPSSPKKKIPPNSASIPGSVANFVNTTIGSGILALPFAFKSSGIVTGWIILVCVAAVQNFMTCLVRIAADVTKRRTYGGVALYILGRRFAVVVDMAVLLGNWGVCVAYVIIVGDLLPPVFQGAVGTDSVFVGRTFVMGMAVAFIMFPLTSLPRINSLRYTSFLALVCIMYLCGYIVFRAMGMGLKEKPVLASGGMGVFKTLPICAFAFSCQFNLFPIIDELKNPTSTRQLTVVHTSFAIIASLYLICGTLGYLTFYDEVCGNVLINYLGNDVGVVLARIAVSLVAIFSFPVLAYSVRDAAYRLFFSDDSRGTLRLVLVAFVISGTAYIVAVFLSDITSVLALVGSTASTLLCCFFPSTFYIQLRRSGYVGDGYWWLEWRCIAAALFTLAGFVCGALGVYQTVADLWLGQGQ